MELYKVRKDFTRGVAHLEDLKADEGVNTCSREFRYLVLEKYRQAELCVAWLQKLEFLFPRILDDNCFMSVYAV